VHERLDSTGFLQVERVNTDGHDDEPEVTARRKGKAQLNDLTDLDLWLSRKGEEGTAAAEAADLAALAAEAAAEPPAAISAYVITPAGKVR
jgi:hypothetical protein